MGETLLRNSQLEVVLGAGVAAGCLDPSCSGTYSTLTPTALASSLSNFCITFFSYDAKFPISLVTRTL